LASEGGEIICANPIRSCFLLVGLLLIGSDFGLSGDRVKPETIDATAMGTGTQLGQNIGVTVIIYDYSTPATGRS
jgi:hypothetical protein